MSEWVRPAATMSERELEQSQSDLRASERARRKLLNHLFTVEEEERHKLSGELHDDTIQAMVATLLMLEVARKDAPSPALDRATQLLRESLERTRTMMFELAPAVLTHHGLKPAVEGVINHISTEMDAEIECSIPPLRFDGATEMLVFRLVRECLGNAKKHSRASHVSVAVDYEKPQLAVSVEDDGRGFDVERQRRWAMHTTNFTHVGLPSMIERVELTGGSTEITSEPGHTRIRFWIPATPLLT